MVMCRIFYQQILGPLLAAYIVSATVRESPLIRTDSGLVSGIREAVDGKDVDMYLGIPYAEPPVGLLRFSKPVPVKPWNGTLKVNKRPTPCPQTVHYQTDEVSFYYTKNSEDCLYLNVRKPAAECNDTACDAKLPVVVFIHGGTFQWSDSGLFMHDGSNFAALTDTIFINFNYRLNVFGFLSAGNAEVAGNWALWDQNLALRWVQRNVKKFGGDPTEVTIIGHSAGGIAAGFHAISPEASGLFKRMILQSGSPINVVASLSARSVESVMTLGSDLACDGVRDHKLGVVMECLRGVNKSLLLGQLSGVDLRKSFHGPVYGDEYLPKDPLLLSTWKDRIMSQQIMIGTTFNEGSIFLYNAMKLVPQLRDLLKDDYRSTITVAISTTMGIPLRASKTIVKTYFTDSKAEHSEDEVLQILSNILGDGLFVCPATIFADAASLQKIPVYRYVFGYRPSFSFWPEWFKVAHGDDLPFTLGSMIFYNDRSRFDPGIRREDYYLFGNLKYTEKEKEFMKAMVASMSQFVKTGKPTVPETQKAWPMYSSSNPEYINISPGNTTRQFGPKKKLCMVWKSVLLKDEPKTTTQSQQNKRTPQKTPRRTSSAASKKVPQGQEKQVSMAPESLFLAHYVTIACFAFVFSVHINSCLSFL